MRTKISRPRLFILITLFLVLFGFGPGKSHSRGRVCYQVRPHAQGCMEETDHILNTTIVAKDSNDYRAEYLAGFIQGRLQKKDMLSARDNDWDSAYLTDPDHPFPKQLPPSPADLALARQVLMENYSYTVNYVKNQSDPLLAKNMKRLLFRLLGIYHGARLKAPARLDFSGNWVPDLAYFSTEELEPGYETKALTFIDVYWLNAFSDATDAVSGVLGLASTPRLPKCSAFVKKTGDDIYLTHNTWSSFLNQSMAQTYFINSEFMTFNAGYPGLIASLTDFGYNNHGIMFNETTHHNKYSEPKVQALWMFFRAALAEQFAGSLDEFYKYLSLEASGTYMNGYMVVDARTREIGLVEMSYKTFVYFKPDGRGGYAIITKPDTASKVYDPDLVTGDYLLGINYPASSQIRDDLKAVDNRPSRKKQFLAMIGAVNDMESSKAFITYTDPENPLSIFGRWDLGYGDWGDASNKKIVPDGAVDAKVASASMALAAMKLKGELDLRSSNKAFWMKFGSARVNGEPFIWSKSKWSGTKLRDVPDVIDGDYHLLNLYIR